MRKFGSPSPRLSSMIMLGILLHKLDRNYGALVWTRTGSVGRLKNELCLICLILLTDKFELLAEGLLEEFNSTWR